jgi:ABC-2 type transport system permease protein
MIKKEAIQFWRYKMLLAFALLLPVIQLQGVARTASDNVMQLPMAVYDRDHSASSRRVVAMLENSEIFLTHTYVESMTEMEMLLHKGDVHAGLAIPPDFGADLLSGETATVQVLLDASEPAAASQANAFLERVGPRYARELSGSNAGAFAIQVLTHVEPRTRIWFNEAMDEESFRLPGALASGVAMLAIFLPAAVIVKEREKGTLEQLFVTPIKPIEIIISKAALSLAIAYVAFVEMLALTVFHFEVPMRGSLALLLMLAAFYIFVEMGLGLIISVVARTQGQALLVAFFWSLLERILSGQILPVENMPRAAQIAAQAAPLTYFTAIVREVMLKGAGLPDLRSELIALALLGVGLYALAASRLQKRLD